MYGFALITGATSGIGEAFARTLPSETGLLLTGRDGARLAELAAALGNAGRSVETLAVDLARDAGRTALVERAAALPIDLLINNAGLGALGPLAENDAAREREMVEVNVVAPLVLTRALLPDMLARAQNGGPRAGVILVASTAAFIPLPYMSTYAATKAFDLYLAEGLAGELKKEPVDVLALCPGATRTRFFERAGMSARMVGKAESPERVAREGLAALGRRSLHVVGGQNRAFSLLAGRMPRAIMLDATRSFMRRGWKRYAR